MRAVRCAWWIGHNLLFRGETGPARGWFARARRLLERERRDCVERGYVLIAALLEHLMAGEHEAAGATAVEITEIGDRFGDRDLVAIGLMEKGHAMVRQGRTEEGLRLVDETMVAVTTGELSPIVAGIVYCNTIAFCQSAYELRRAREWTAALTRWCAQQPEMVAHNGLCLVHRAQLMTLGGSWRGRAGRAPPAGRALHRGGAEQAGARPRRLRRGRAAPPPGRVRGGRGRLPRGQRARARAAAGAGAPAPGAGRRRLRGGGDPPRGGRDDPAARARGAPARIRRDDAGRRRSRGRAQRQPRARRDRRAARHRPAGGVGRPGARGGGDRRGRRSGRAGRVARRMRGVAGARRAVRGRSDPRAAGGHLPVAGRRGHGRARAGGGSRRPRSTGSRARPRLGRRSHRPRPWRRTPTA